MTKDEINDRLEDIDTLIRHGLYVLSEEEMYSLLREEKQLYEVLEDLQIEDDHNDLLKIIGCIK